MDPDTEFNALAALYSSVVADMKHSYPAWELVGQRALKLSTHLKTAVQALAAFVDAVQAVSDYANNLKGASRDVGACVTRICMRERALEGRFRAWADALSDELAVTVQQRTGYWKKRTDELDKTACKHLKKVRSRKARPDESAVREQRTLCHQALAEQRQQIAFFVSALNPVLSAEMSLLDEGPNIRQVIESLDNTIKHVDSNDLVHTILADLTGGADGAWRHCLQQAGRAHDAQMLSATSPSQSKYCVEDNDATPMSARPLHHTISAGSDAGGEGGARRALSINTYCPPAGQTMSIGRPPLQRRPSAGSIKCVPPPDPPASVSFRSSTHSVADEGTLRIQRPQSFAGELRTNYTHSNYATTSFGQQHNGFAPSSSCSSSDAASSAAMIAETLQQIDQLGSDLENYCNATDVGVVASACAAPSTASTLSQSQFEREATEYALPKQHQAAYQAQPVRVRAGDESKSSRFYATVKGIRMFLPGSRPPPPARRSSTITAATPTAPSVADSRMSMGSLMGSRQSLNGSSQYGGTMSSAHSVHYGTIGRAGMGSNQDLRFANVNPNSRQY